MSLVRSIFGVTVAVGLTFSGAATAAAPERGPAAEKPVAELVSQTVTGKKALQIFAGRIDDLSRRNGLSSQRMYDVLRSDASSRIDRDARLFFVEPVAPEATRDDQAAVPARLAADAFALHSKPGSRRVIYLDFTGHYLTGTAWNASKGVDPVNITPYDTDGAPGSFSTAERAVVQEVWQRVADDYLPFDVDVTTQDPGTAAINRSSADDLNYGTRVVIDPTAWYQSGCGCGGVAYVGVFDSTNNGYNQPAWVFTRGVGNGAKNIAEAAAHEAGHNLGLGHDGTSTTGYYGGHGAWAPIMGVGYGKAISQWSKGEYADANNKQDDFAVMGANGAAVRPADYGTSLAAATAISPGQVVSGVNAALNDVDYFRISLSPGNHTFIATPAAAGANLDIELTLYNGAGSVLGTYNPASGQSSASTATGLGASTTWTLNGGTYYVRVDDSGYGNPLNTGYSTYGSHGGFTLQVT